MKKTIYILAIVLITLNSGCSSDSDSGAFIVPQQLITTWELTDIELGSNTFTSPDDESIQITFNNDTSFSGSTSLNTFNGSFATNNGILRIGNFVTTEVEETAFGERFFDFLTAGGTADNPDILEFSFSVQGNILMISFSGGTLILNR